MDLKHVALFAALLPAAAFAGQPDAYFGLKSQDDLFERVRDRVIEYWTPNFNGFEAGVSQASRDDVLPFSRVGVSLGYTFGKGRAFLETESDSGWLSHAGTRVGAGYALAGDTRFDLGLAEDRYDLVSGAAKNLRVGSWHVSLVRDVGASGRIRMAFTQENSWIPGFQGMVSQVSLGYGQALTDRAEIFALYSRSSSGFSQNAFGLGGGPNAIGLGMKYSF